MKKLTYQVYLSNTVNKHVTLTHFFKMTSIIVAVHIMLFKQMQRDKVTEHFVFQCTLFLSSQDIFM